MTLARDTSAAARRVQLEALRRLTPGQRLEIAAAMSDDARRISEAGIRHRHPEWDDDQVHAALLDLLLGSELAAAVREPRPTGP